MADLNRAIHSALKDCLNLKRNETILIVADSPLQELGYRFYQSAKNISKNSNLIILPELTGYGEPSKSVATFMNNSEVIVLITSRSLSHTMARRRASKNGARIASLPGITPEALTRTMNGNYREIKNRSRKLADILTIGRSVHLTTKQGTDLVLSISKMKGYPDTGMIHEPGQFSNLPAGEGCAAPVPGSANGTLVIDGSFPGIGKIVNPIKMSVKDGYVVRISGDSEAQIVRKLIRPFGKDARKIAEIGIGTNPHAKFTGCTLEDEKVLGTVHIGFGNNVSFGGRNDICCHFDAVLLKPTLTIDEHIIIKDGELRV